MPIPDLVPLHTGHPGIRTTLHVTVAPASPKDQISSSLPSLPSVNSLPDPIPENSCNSCLHDNSCNSCLDFISSDATLDRYGEIITPAGWDLRNYLRNPVFQNAHQYGDIIFTLGRALVTEIRSGKLFQRIQFATDANPLAKIAHSLYAGKFLSAVSVGFIPRRWENGSQDTAFTRKYLEQELLEVSAVSIPANPNALALAVKSGAVGKSDLKDTADLINHTLASAQAASAVSNDSALRTPHSALLSLARQIRSQLKHL